MIHPVCSSRRSLAAGFTLLEVIVVVAILGIMATMMIPRLVGQDRRAVRLAGDQLADLLTMYAQREALAQRPAGIWHDAQHNWIVLMVLDIDPADPEAPADWRLDPYVSPVKLPSTVDWRYVQAIQDGEQVDFQKWPITTQPGEPRPTIEISFANQEGLSKTVILPAHALAPYQLGGPRPYSDLRYPFDLDAAGRQQEDW